MAVPYNLIPVSPDALRHRSWLLDLSKPVIMLPEMFHVEEVYACLWSWNPGYGSLACEFGIAKRYVSSKRWIWGLFACLAYLLSVIWNMWIFGYTCSCSSSCFCSCGYSSYIHTVTDYRYWEYTVVLWDCTHIVHNLIHALTPTYFWTLPQCDELSGSVMMSFFLVKRGAPISCTACWDGYVMFAECGMGFKLAQLGGAWEELERIRCENM